MWKLGTGGTISFMGIHKSDLLCNVKHNYSFVDLLVYTNNFSFFPEQYLNFAFRQESLSFNAHFVFYPSDLKPNHMKIPYKVDSYWSLPCTKTTAPLSEFPTNSPLAKVISPTKVPILALLAFPGIMWPLLSSCIQQQRSPIGHLPCKHSSKAIGFYPWSQLKAISLELYCSHCAIFLSKLKLLSAFLC